MMFFSNKNKLLELENKLEVLNEDVGKYTDEVKLISKNIEEMKLILLDSYKKGIQNINEVVEIKVQSTLDKINDINKDLNTCEEKIESINKYNNNLLIKIDEKVLEVKEVISQKNIIIKEEIELINNLIKKEGKSILDKTTQIGGDLNLHKQDINNIVEEKSNDLLQKLDEYVLKIKDMICEEGKSINDEIISTKSLTEEGKNEILKNLLTQKKDITKVLKKEMNGVKTSYDKLSDQNELLKKSIEKYSKNLNNMENNLEHQKSEFDNLEESIRLLLINSILNEIPNE